MRACVLGLVILVCGISSVASAQSGAIAACFQAKNGQLRIVQAGQSCLPSELPISWNSGSSRGFTIVDSHGATVGYPVDDLQWSSPVIGMSVGNDWVGVRVSTSGFWVNEAPARWTTPDCSGDVVLMRSTLSFVQTAMVVNESSGPVIYAPGQAIEPAPPEVYENMAGFCDLSFPFPGEVATTPVRIVPSAVPPFTLVR